MWCKRCHYGSECYRPTARRCPQCGSSTGSIARRPFPETPQGMGSGRRRKKAAKGGA